MRMGNFPKIIQVTSENGFVNSKPFSPYHLTALTLMAICFNNRFKQIRQ